MAPDPSYKTHDPKGWCGDPTRGAAMGRPCIHTEPTFEGALTLRHVRLDEGGYDENGTYFGSGNGVWPIFWYASDDGEIDAVLRAKDEAAARVEIQKRYPRATFREDVALDERFRAFVAGYIEAALYSTNDESDESGGVPLDDNYEPEDFLATARERIERDCRRFFDAHREHFAGRDERAGRDFWYTRNGHGCGFWDGDWPEPAATILDKASKHEGEADVDVVEPATANDPGKLDYTSSQ